MEWREYFAAVKGYDDRQRELLTGIMLAFNDPKALQKSLRLDSDYSNESKPQDLLAKFKKQYEKSGIPWSDRLKGVA